MTTTRKLIFNPFTGNLDYISEPFSSDVDFVENGNDLELWWKVQKQHTWTYEPPVAVSGSPIGLLLSLTYA